MNVLCLYTASVVASLALSTSLRASEDFHSLKSARDLKAFIFGLGKPTEASGWLGVTNPKNGDLKSDILLNAEHFHLSEKAIDTIFRNFEIYPIIPFNGYPLEIDTFKFPDVEGWIIFNFPNGSDLMITFKALDSISLGYKPSKDARWESKDNLLWPCSEFLSTILYPLTDKDKQSRWRSHD